MFKDTKAKGNEYYMNGDYDKAIETYLSALGYTEDDGDMAVCHANIGACYLGLEDYPSAVEACGKALELNEGYTKCRFRRVRALELSEKYSEALEDLQILLGDCPGNAEYLKKKTSIATLLAKQREEQQAEVMDKLKSLGNTVLGKFGMSLDNFNAVKDPETGSYSIQMNK